MVRFTIVLLATLVVAAGAPARATNNDNGKGGDSSSTATAIAGGGTAVASGGDAEADSKSTSISGSSSSSKATQIGINKQAQGQQQGQVAVGKVTTQIDASDNSVYKEAVIPVFTAAALPGGDCIRGGASVQFKDVGASLVGDDLACQHRLIARDYFSVALNLTALRSALAAEHGDGKGKGVKIADKVFEEMARESHRKGFDRLQLAEAEIDRADTRVRRFFRVTLGSLPILNRVAP